MQNPLREALEAVCSDYDEATRGATVTKWLTKLADEDVYSLNDVLALSDEDFTSLPISLVGCEASYGR